MQVVKVVKAVKTVLDADNADNAARKILELIDLVETFECICPYLLRLAHTSATMWNAISRSKRIRPRFKDIQNFHKMITNYKGIGWFDYISIEYVPDYTSKIGIRIRMCKRSIGNRINTININQSLFDSNSVYRKAVIRANYDMMIKYKLGSSSVEVPSEVPDELPIDAINVIATHFEDLGETNDMCNKRYTLSQNIINIIHNELWNLILTALGNSNMCFSNVDLRDNDLITLPGNFNYINDKAYKVDLRGNPIVKIDPNLDNCVVRWDTECLLKPTIQNARKEWRIQHPINLAVVQNECRFPIELKKIQRSEEENVIWRLVGYAYGSENLNNSAIMNMLIDIYEKFHENGLNINCSEKNKDRLYRSYNPSIEHLFELENARHNKPDLNVCFRDFIID